jgi:hypothetical protein
MVMADDALSVNKGTWGGAREKKWHVEGKRAVVHVPPDVYQLVDLLAGLARRPTRDLCSQIFCAGMESLLGHSIEILRGGYQVRPLQGSRANQPKPMTHEEIREMVSQCLVFVGENA